MTVRPTRADRVSAPAGSVEFDADVLVIGGGPAGAWGAVRLAQGRRAARPSRARAWSWRKRAFADPPARPPQPALASGTLIQSPRYAKRRWPIARSWAVICRTAVGW